MASGKAVSVTIRIFKTLTRCENSDRHADCLPTCHDAVHGCATEPLVTKSIKDRIAAHPDAYCRVEVLPIWFEGSAVMDASLTADELKALNRQVGTNLLTALKQVLADKGYEVVQTGPVLCGDEDLEAFDADTRRLLGAVRTHFVDLSQQIYANRPNLKGKSLEYKP